MSDKDDEERKKKLSDETAENVKRNILYGTGYGKPPKETQFKKGKSGNPKGSRNAHRPCQNRQST